MIERAKPYELVRRRFDEYMADTLEVEASRMPPQHRERAEALRKHAQTLRSSSNQETVDVWRPVGDKW